jgi:hypothetical protein
MERCGTANLQKDRNFGPKFDLPILDSNGALHPSISNSTELKTLFIPHENNVDPIEGCESEMQALISDRDYYYFTRLQVAEKVATLLSSTNNHVRALELPVIDNHDYAQCPLCLKIYDSRKQVCDGAVACGVKGPLTKYKNGEKVVAAVAKKTDYGGQIMPSMQPLCRTRNYVRCSVDTTVSMEEMVEDLTRTELSLNTTLEEPNAKLFGLTTGLAVMKINSELGYEPVTYSELTDDEEFWAGCKSCVNYEILMSKDRKNCMCTAMLYEPKLTTTTNDSSNKTTTEISLEDSTESSKGVASKLLNWFRKK